MSYRLSVKDFQLKKTGASDISTLKILTGTSGTSQIFFGDTAIENVGLIKYNHLTDTFSVYTSSTERLTILSTGYVGIGTISPQVSLEIVGSLRLQGPANFPTTGSGLEIFYNSSFSEAGIQSYNRSTSSYINTFVDGLNLSFRTGGSERMRIDTNGLSTVKNATNPGANPTVGVYGLAIDNSQPSWPSPALLFKGNSINAAAIEILDQAGSTYNMVFKVASTDTNGILGTVMTLKSNGNVGIGGAPLYQLHQNTATITRHVLQGGLATVASQGAFTTWLDGVTAHHIGHASAIYGNASADFDIIAGNTKNLRFITSDTDRLTIDSAGRVGINVVPTAGAQFRSASTTEGTAIVATCAGAGGSTNYCMQMSATGATLANTGLYVGASGASNNYGIRIVNPMAAANSYALYCDATANSYFAGSVGIGALPSYKLHIEQNTAGQMDILYLRNANGAQSDSVAIGFTNTHATFLSKIVGYVGDVGNNGGGLKIQLRNGNSGAMYDGVLMKDNGGSPLVGIGIVPADVLHIYKSTGIACLHSQGDQCGSKWSTTAGTLRFITGLRSDIHASNFIFHSYAPNWSFYNAKVAIGAIDATNGQLHVNGSVSYTPATYSGAGTNTTWSTGMTAAVNSSIWASNSLVASGVYSYSDKRMKKDIEEVSSLEALSFITSAKPSKFKWKSSNESDYGFIAQDILKAGFNNLVGAIPEEGLSELIEDNFISPENKKLIVKYEAIIPILTRALQDLRKEFDDFKQQHS